MGIALALGALVASPAWAGSPPTVSKVGPRTGFPGSEARISGTNFEEVLEVRFGTTAATSFTTLGTTGIAVTVPNGTPGLADVTVVTASGTSEATSADVFYTMVLGEYGRCLRFFGEGSWGEFKKNDCIVESEKFSPYAWYPGFGAFDPIEKTGFAISGGAVKLETVTKKAISCASVTGSGNYTGPQDTTETLTFKGCADGSANCSSEGAAAGEVTTLPLHGLVGGLPKSDIGEAFAPASGETVAELDCSGTTVTISGSFIGEVKKEGAMATSTKWKAKEKKGVAVVTSTSDFPEAAMHMKFGAGSSEGAGLKATYTRTSEEEIEIR